MRIVVSDTGPILHLREAGALEVLQFAGEIIVPAAADNELLRLVDDWPTTRPVWLQRHTLGAADPSSPLHELVVGLGAGETEAILLAHQIEADWLLTNDAEAQAALDRLAKSSLWISANILSEARAALPKLTEKP